MNKSIYKIFSGFAVVFMLASIAFLLYISYQGDKNPDKIPSLFGYKPFTVLTNSMKPSFSAGDMVLVKDKPASKIKPNDVITFKENNNKLITHRVVKVTDKGFVTKGDYNNVKDDGFVSPENVVGELVFTLPKLGYVSKFVSSPLGITLLIFIPLLAYLLLEIYDFLKRFIERKEKQKAV
ncbi:signal peptidase I [Fictibacillus barbaricus]|uniref:Signal peptidase I n=1 Tax=Fictibacillus barbaricus TaxID=182136 RepID=A0ABU1U1P2_9BACL|nr:signal peptidase I [Fictibacillus barbaricus]MDR7073340.1 signal peptidase [Fictibacillus barbaricus]